MHLIEEIALLSIFLVGRRNVDFTRHLPVARFALLWLLLGCNNALKIKALSWNMHVSCADSDIGDTESIDIRGAALALALVRRRLFAHR